MKVNLECGNDIRSGYLNVNSFPIESVPEKGNFIMGRYNNLDPILKEKVDEIIFNPFLNCISPNDLVPIIQHWTDKLKTGGILKISFLDIRRIAKDIHTDKMPVQGMHSAIYGKNGENKCLIYTAMIKPLAKEFNLTIESITIRDIFVTVEMRKND